MLEDSPIFVRGYSRSGGTLMVTILDAHPDIAMSYELYPNLLISKNGTDIELDLLLEILNKSKNNKTANKKIKDRNLQTLVQRCLRGSLDSKNLARLLKQHIADRNDFSDVKGRLRFIERCCVEKMKNADKSKWGLKCNNQYDDYLSMWPSACFLNVVRDGRDVLASQLNTGSFNKSPADVAEGWVKTHLRFRKLVDNQDVRAYEVFYEKLVNQPDEELKKICDFLSVPFEKSMLNFYQQGLTIYKANHLSMNMISRPIDSSKVNRWKKDLNENQLQEFYSVARDAMIMFGYLGENEC